MDNGPFRMGNPASTARDTRSRSVAPRTETVRETPVERDVPHRAPVQHSASPSRQPAGPNKKKTIIIGAIIAVTVIAGILFGWWLLSRPNNAAAVAIDGSKYQAVFFTNGQVYFGKLHAVDNDYMKLTDVFYLQTKDASTDNSKNPQKTAESTAGDVQLIKLGNEIHGPDGEMVISKNQMLFFENLKTDGKVASSIDQYHKSNK